MIEAKFVPPLRQELTFKPSGSDHDGSPAWLMHDPVINKFYRISWLDYEMISRWGLAKIDAIVASVNAQTTLEIDESDVLGLVAFSEQNQLIKTTTSAQVNQLIDKKTAMKQGKLAWLLKHYLFIRIPLIKPQYLLKAILPYLSWCFSKQAASLAILLTMTGLFLAARQWETFTATLVDQLTFGGIVSFSLALVFSKCLHEFGHAITATRYGVRVGHMGVALLVLFPMPYTDTSESWKLTNNRHRLHIAAAGIIVELALAGMATLLWSVSPEGSFKSALFFLATTSWVLTLLVNLSPFLRFDGYFILSDILDFPNLHQRAGALGKVSLRRKLLGFTDDWPEVLSASKRRWLIAFASLTWAYRMVLFIGIAWLVYYFFFKVLGVILFLVEIWWFIVLPNLTEIKVWFMRKNEIKTNRMVFGSLVLLGLITLGFVPWQTNVEGAGWLHATKQHLIYTPTAGKLATMHAPGQVLKGERLFTLASPDIALNALRSKSMVDARNIELSRLSGVEDGESRRLTLQSERDQFSAEVKLYQDELGRMDLTAPFDGLLMDIHEDISPNTWVNPREPLAILIDPNSWAADAYIAERDINRVKLGNKVKLFVLESELATFEGEVTEINTSKVHKLPHPILNAVHGGQIATLPNSEGVPTKPFYKVRVVLNNINPQVMHHMLVGDVKIETEAKAWLPTVFERFAALFIRESGF